MRSPARTAGSGANVSCGHPLDPATGGRWRLQADPTLAQRLERVVVAVLAVERVEQDRAWLHVGVDVDRGDREQHQAIVVDALELSATISRTSSLSRAVRGYWRLAVGAAPATAGHYCSTSSQCRLPSRTSISGNDHTNRSTPSITSTGVRRPRRTATKVSPARWSASVVRSRPPPTW